MPPPPFPGAFHCLLLIALSWRSAARLVQGRVPQLCAAFLLLWANLVYTGLALAAVSKLDSLPLYFGSPSAPPRRSKPFSTGAKSAPSPHSRPRRQSARTLRSRSTARARRRPATRRPRFRRHLSLLRPQQLGFPHLPLQPRLLLPGARQPAARRQSVRSAPPLLPFQRRALLFFLRHLPVGPRLDVRPHLPRLDLLGTRHLVRGPLYGRLTYRRICRRVDLLARPQRPCPSRLHQRRDPRRSPNPARACLLPGMDCRPPPPLPPARRAGAGTRHGNQAALAASISPSRPRPRSTFSVRALRSARYRADLIRRAPCPTRCRRARDAAGLRLCHRQLPLRRENHRRGLQRLILNRPFRISLARRKSASTPPTSSSVRFQTCSLPSIARSARRPTRPSTGSSCAAVSPILRRPPSARPRATFSKAPPTPKAPDPTSTRCGSASCRTCCCWPPLPARSAGTRPRSPPPWLFRSGSSSTPSAATTSPPPASTTASPPYSPSPPSAPPGISRAPRDARRRGSCWPPSSPSSPPMSCSAPTCWPSAACAICNSSGARPPPPKCTPCNPPSPPPSRAARRIYIPYTHWEVLYWNFMRFNPAARYSTGIDLRMPSPDTMLLLSAAREGGSDLFPARLPAGASDGLLYLGDADGQPIYAQGGGVGGLASRCRPATCCSPSGGAPMPPARSTA